MSDPQNLTDGVPFDEETWSQLPEFLGNLPEPVALHVWADEEATAAEREAIRLAKLLADRFPDKIAWRSFPRRANYAYYPVMGIMSGTAETFIDLGLRIIGLPIGYQMTSLVAAIQAVSFRGQTLEPVSRVKLHQLNELEKHVAIELVTLADDETGALVAKPAFGAAAASPWVKTFLIIVDFFPEAAQLYASGSLPHMVINKRVHFEGPLDEDELLRQIGLAVKGEQEQTNSAS
jgi:alkyl hydroperoxide reductase subunit AhpF